MNVHTNSKIYLPNLEVKLKYPYQYILHCSDQSDDFPQRPKKGYPSGLPTLGALNCYYVDTMEYKLHFFFFFFSLG